MRCGRSRRPGRSSSRPWQTAAGSKCPGRPLAMRRASLLRRTRRWHRRRRTRWRRRRRGRKDERSSSGRLSGPGAPGEGEPEAARATLRIMGRRAMGAFVAGVVAVLLGCGAGARPEVRPATAPPVVAMPPVIVTPTEVTTEAELAARGEQALMEQRWRDAADAFAVLVGADPGGPLAPERMFDLGLALEGLQERVRARRVVLVIAPRLPDGPRGRRALVTDAS